MLFKHRSVWEAIGRDDFTRDEVLQALKHHKEDGLVDQVRKGNNNFQVFWTRCGAESAEPGQETEQTSADEQQQALRPRIGRLLLRHRDVRGALAQGRLRGAE